VADDVLRLKPGDDVRMMQTPDLWPLGPVLPLANEETGEKGALILHANIRRTEVFKVNLFDPRLRTLIAGDPTSLASTVFVSFEQAYEHGWRVN
jgi:hypothetical protein